MIACGSIMQSDLWILITILVLFVIILIITAMNDSRKLTLLESLPDGPEKDSAILRAFPPYEPWPDG